MESKEKVLQCECGFEARAQHEDGLVAEVQRHAREAHGMALSPEQALLSPFGRSWTRRLHPADTCVKPSATPRPDVRVARVEIAPGGYSGWHHHPGIVIVTVASGAVTFTHSDCSSKTYGPSERCRVRRGRRRPGPGLEHYGGDELCEAYFQGFSPSDGLLRDRAHGAVDRRCLAVQAVALSGTTTGGSRSSSADSARARFRFFAPT